MNPPPILLHVYYILLVRARNNIVTMCPGGHLIQTQRARSDDKLMRQWTTPVRRQAITWTNAGLLLIRPWKQVSVKYENKIQQCYKNRYLKMVSVESRFLSTSVN